METEARSQKLLDIIKEGILRQTQTNSAHLGDRKEYVGMSDIGAYIDCPRKAVLNKLNRIRNQSFASLLTLTRGHWFERGIASAIRSLDIHCVEQLEISVCELGTPIKAHLDFLFATSNPHPTIRVLELKSCRNLPDKLYASYEAQAYGQVSLLQAYWNERVFSLKDYTGKTVFSKCTFPQAASKLWSIKLPAHPEEIDIECWVLALSMNDAKVFGPYIPNQDMLVLCLKYASELWKSARHIGNKENIASLKTASGFHPLCDYCDYSGDCPKFAGEKHPELGDDIDELFQWKSQRQVLDAKIKDRERAMIEWYAKVDRENGWIDVGGKRFRTIPVAGRRSYDMEGLANDLGDIFHKKCINDIEITDLFARHTKVSEPTTRLLLGGRK